MRNYKNEFNNVSNSYSSYFEKRKEIRRKAKLSSPIWSSPSTSEDETPDDLYKSFFKTNFYFTEEPIKKKEKEFKEPINIISIEKLHSRSLSEENPRNESEIQNEQAKIENENIPSTLLGRKTLRDEEGFEIPYNSDSEQNIPQSESASSAIQNNNNNIDAAKLIKAKQVDIKFNEREIRKIIQGAKVDKRELERFAPYIQQGKRIPRRGEVGLTSEAIENFEKLGYVMSGSRHKKMTSAREMKEKQIYTVEEKKALAIFNLEEQQRKEISIIENFKKIMQDKQGTEKDEEGFYIEKKEKN